MLFNFCLLISCAFLLSLTYREWPVRRRPAEHALRLALAAGTTWLLMLYTVRWGDFRFDLRYVPVALVTLRYGPLAGGLTLLPALGWRFLENMPGGTVAAINGLSVLLLAGVLRPRLRVDVTHWRDLWLAPVPFLGLSLGLWLTPQGRALFPLMYPLGVLLSAAGLVVALLILQSRLRLLRATRILRTQAHTDALTGLGNRRQFDEDMAALDAGNQLVLLDIDHFKVVNDTHGHAAGDRTLEHIAALLRELNPAHLRPYRVGGEEFALLADLGGEGRTRALVEGLLRQLPAAGTGVWAGLTLSAGLATRAPGESAGALFRRADEALYLAKTNGRDRLVAWTPPAGPPGAVPPAGNAAAPAAGVILPRYSVWQALRTTVGLLAQRRILTDGDWAEVLHLAVDAVDGAGGGSLDIREGGVFRLCAAEGYGQALVGLRLAEASQQRWYGRPLEDWRAGRPRVLGAAELRAVYAESDEFLEGEVIQTLSSVGRRDDIRANLCLPVVLGGEVVAHLNLDALVAEDGFNAQSIEVAELFAQQIAALLHLQKRWRELKRLGELHTQMSDGQIGSGPDPLPAEQRVTETALDLLRAQRAVLLRYDAAEDRLLSQVIENDITGFGPVILRRGEGLAWAALLAGEVMCVADVRADARVYRRGQLDPAAMMAVPLLTHDRQPLGVLVLTREVERPFLADDENLALMLASLAARLLERGAHLGDLRATLEAALNTLGFALEARDFETQGHTERVQRHALTFGQALGLSAERLLGLRQGAALHDIGKLGVPDAVLLKPGRLSAEERQVVEGHAPLGAALAARIPFLHPEAHGVVRSHHERWDGLGYPDGLAGETIPPLARLFALCDVYDALVSARPYRGAMPPAEALALLEAGRGTQFDPELTDLFVTLWHAGAFAQTDAEGHPEGSCPHAAAERAGAGSQSRDGAGAQD